MATTPENPTPPATNATPDARAEQEGRQADPAAAPAPAVGPGVIPASTQSQMGDGSGIRGDYGNASQTNGLEGGPDSAPDGSPKQA